MLVLNHVSFHVFDLTRSLAFYRDALGLTPLRELLIEEGRRQLVFLGDGITDFRLELSYEKDRKKPYPLGGDGLHIGMHTDEFDALHAKHRAMGCICEENPTLGIYFIQDPDGHRIELVPKRN